MGGMERIKGERIELQSDMAEKHDQNRLNFGRFDVEKLRFFFKNALGRSSKLCFPCRRGARFQKNNNKAPRPTPEKLSNLFFLKDTLLSLKVDTLKSRSL